MSAVAVRATDSALLDRLSRAGACRIPLTIYFLSGTALNVDHVVSVTNDRAVVKDTHGAIRAVMLADVWKVTRPGGRSWWPAERKEKSA